MSTEEQRGPSYARPEAYYPGYRGSLAYEELASDELPVVNVSPDTPVSSGAPLPQHGPQPLWQATYQLHPAQSGWITPTHRLALAIISVGMMALFSMIILTSTQNTSTGLIGVGIMCGSILLVNAVFNRGA